MLRTRLLSFAVGFSVTGAAISMFVWRDLQFNRRALDYEMEQKFGDLEARVLNLESVRHQYSKSSQVEG